MYELSLIELESELSTELPTRNLMCRRRHVRRHHACNNGGNGGNGGNSAFANNGSGANAASQSATVAPVQTAVGTNGDAKNIITGGINVNQSVSQQNSPVNLALG